MLLPYNLESAGNFMKKSKRAIAKPRRVKVEAPEIFVRTGEGYRASYAHASLRIKSGKYVYLVWRDGGRIRNFYLGRKRDS
jgi:hypothetical protein